MCMSVAISGLRLFTVSPVISMQCLERQSCQTKMGCRYLTALSVLLLLIVTGNGQQQKACTDLADCMTEAHAKYEECKALVSENDDNNLSLDVDEDINTDATGCPEEMRGKIIALKDLKMQQADQMLQCVRRRADEAVELKGKKANKCRRRVAGVSRRFGRMGKGKKAGTVRACAVEYKQLNRKCRAAMKCCSESAICSLDAQMSPVHMQVLEAKKEILLLRRECTPRSDRRGGRRGRRNRGRGMRRHEQRRQKRELNGAILYGPEVSEVSDIETANSESLDPPIWHIAELSDEVDYEDDEDVPMYDQW